MAADLRRADGKSNGVGVLVLAQTLGGFPVAVRSVPHGNDVGAGGRAGTVRRRSANVSNHGDNGAVCVGCAHLNVWMPGSKGSKDLVGNRPHRAQVLGLTG